MTLPGVFRPRSDSLVLAEHVRRETLPDHARVLDLCTGSGVVALAAAERRESEVWAVDVSRRSVLTVGLNARLNGVRVKAVRGDLFEAVSNMQFDLIVSNPPYLPSPIQGAPTRGAARAWEAGHSGRLFLDRICERAAAHLRPGGVVMLIHSSVCGEGSTRDMLAQSGLRTEVVYRSRGQLGPLLRARAHWLRQRGLLGPEDEEELLIVRAEKPKRVEAQPSLRSSLIAAAASPSR